MSSERPTAAQSVCLRRGRSTCIRIRAPQGRLVPDRLRKFVDRDAETLDPIIGVGLEGSMEGRGMVCAVREKGRLYVM